MQKSILTRALRLGVPALVMTLAAVTVFFLPPAFSEEGASKQSKVSNPVTRPVSAPRPEDLLIVQLTASADRGEFDSFLEEARGTVIRTIEFGPTVKFLVVQAEAGRAAELAKKLQSCKEIAQVQGNTKLTANDGAPNDPYFSGQWGLHFMSYAHGRNYMLQHAPVHSGQTVTMCFLDTGLSPRFASELTSSAVQYDFSGANPTGAREALYDSDPPISHGTATASVACSTNNNQGIAGNANIVTGNRINLIELRITSTGSGSTNLLNIILGLSFIYNHVPQPVVINCSFGAPYPYCLNNSPSIQQAARTLWSAGSLLVVSAGNDGIADPSRETPYVRRVAALGQDGRLAYFSEFGPFHGAAPGVNILCYNPGSSSGLTSYSGTSFSAPAWAAAVADIMRLQARKSASVADAVIHQTARTCPGGWLSPNLAAAAQYMLGN